MTAPRRNSSFSTRWVPFRPVRREICIIESPSQCCHPRKKGSQLCAAHDEETNQLAADRLAAGWPS